MLRRYAASHTPARRCTNERQGRSAGRTGAAAWRLSSPRRGGWWRYSRGQGARPTTAAKAPLTTRWVPPVDCATVASDIFVAGSNGTNLINRGKSPASLPPAAVRMAPSTGSCPPSELANAASIRTRAASKPGIGRTSVTLSSLRVKVPVLSVHKISIDAASSTAERRSAARHALPRPAHRAPTQG
jgi:hypothetical protein